MGYAERAAAELRASLAGLKVALDVQHLYQQDKPNDRGTVYTLGDGSRVCEAQAAVAYAQAAGTYLTQRGAQVLTNQPTHGILLGHYWTRNRAANAWGAHAYLACHVNAGGGDYFLAEYMLASPGAGLGISIGNAVVGAFPAIQGVKTNPLVRGQRGAVCIESTDATMAAIVLEPFFGDRARFASLFAPENLARLGTAIGIGIGQWWARRATA